MQGGGRSWLRILAGAADLVSIDARPLILAFAICGGAASYFALPAEPERISVLAINAVLLVVWWSGGRRGSGHGQKPSSCLPS